MERKTGGISGNRGSGSGDLRVGEVKSVRRAPGGSDKRVDVIMKGEGVNDREKASIYMNGKYAKDLKTNKKYEFELEKREKDKERGQGTKFGKTRKTYRCDSEPSETTSTSGFRGPGGSSRKSRSARWFH